MLRLRCNFLVHPSIHLEDPCHACLFHVRYGLNYSDTDQMKIGPEGSVETSRTNNSIDFVMSAISHRQSVFRDLVDLFSHHLGIVRNERLEISMSRSKSASALAKVIHKPSTSNSKSGNQKFAQSFIVL